MSEKKIVLGGLRAGTRPPVAGEKVSDTPRADEWQRGHEEVRSYDAAINFARQLEREIKQMVDKAAAQSLDGYRKLGAKCAGLEEKSEQEGRDAARYIWLRDTLAEWTSEWHDGTREWYFPAKYIARGVTLDDAIDATMKDGK